MTDIDKKTCDNCRHRAGEEHHWRTGWCECYGDGCYFNEDDANAGKEAQRIINGDVSFAERCIHYVRTHDANVPLTKGFDWDDEGERQ